LPAASPFIAELADLPIGLMRGAVTGTVAH
jgi:hypothetical protein